MVRGLGSTWGLRSGWMIRSGGGGGGGCGGGDDCDDDDHDHITHVEIF